MNGRASLMIVLLAHQTATAAEGTTLGAIAEAAKKPGDKSRQALVSIFGEVVNNPLAGAGGGADTTLAAMFQIINSVLLVVGALFICYVWFRNLSKVAHDGTIFNRDLHTLWSPIRLVWGIVCLVPTANGWALSQLLILWAAAVLGVGSANLSTTAALNAFKEGKGMVVEPAVPRTVAMARSIYEANLCMHSVNAGLSAIARDGGFNFPAEYVQEFGTPNGFILKNGNGGKVCGGASIPAELLEAKPASTAWFGPTVDGTPIYRAHHAGLTRMQSALREDALSFVNATVKQIDGTPSVLPDSNLAIERAAQEYERSIQAAGASRMGSIQLLATELNSNMNHAGWWSLGAWYQTFATANSKLAEAVAGRAQLYGESFAENSGDPAIRQSVLKRFRMQQATNTDAKALGQESANEISDSRKLVVSIISSPGAQLLHYLTSDAFGGNESATSNPLMKMKTIGDYTLMTAEVATATFVGASAAVGAAKGSIIGTVLDKFSGAASAVSGALDAIRPFFLMIAIPLFLVGAGLSIYLPLVPFIVWFGAIVNWLIIVLEGVIAAPLWAMAHLDGNGEGMGERSAYGYLFLLNVITRPFLMVVGFMAGGGCLVVGGTFLNQIFGIAVANVQFNSFTGLVSLLGFLFIYLSLSLNLVHSCFNLILIVPDQVINWVGGLAPQHLGRDTNDAVRSGVNVLMNRLEHMHRGPSVPSQTSRLKPGNGVKR